MMNRREFLSQVGLGAAGLVLLPGCASLTGARGASLPRSTPEAEGISSSAIRAFLDAVAEKKFEMHGFVIARHGRVIAEGWWKPYGPQYVHTLYSMSKSFTSTAVGFAVAEKRLTVDDRVTKFFPDDLPASVSDNLAALRVRDLLTMSVGNEKEPTKDVIAQENWARTFLAAPITKQPGSTFMYNSAATYMCSAIVQKLTGQRIVDYLRPRLFEPLGIEQALWEVCPRGINTGGWGLSVQTESLAKFGQLYLQKGMWNGRQILPASWVAEATSKHIQQPLPAKPGRPNEENDWVQGYGYQFWRCTHGGYRGDGAYGQFTVVLPEQDAVIAINSECGNMQGQLDLVWQHLLPAMKNAPLPADAAAHDELQRTISSLALSMPAGNATSPAAAKVSGKTVKLAANDLGLESVALVFGSNTCSVNFREAKRAHPITCGIGHWQRGETSLPGTPPRLTPGGKPPAGTLHKYVGAGAWKDDNTFELLMRFYESAHHDRITFTFNGSEVEVRFLGSLAAMNGKPNDARPVLRGTLA